MERDRTPDDMVSRYEILQLIAAMRDRWDKIGGADMDQRIVALDGIEEDIRAMDGIEQQAEQHRTPEQLEYAIRFATRHG